MPSRNAGICQKCFSLAIMPTCVDIYLARGNGTSGSEEAMGRVVKKNQKKKTPCPQKENWKMNMSYVQQLKLRSNCWPRSHLHSGRLLYGPHLYFACVASLPARVTCNSHNSLSRLQESNEGSSELDLPESVLAGQQKQASRTPSKQPSHKSIENKHASHARQHFLSSCSGDTWTQSECTFLTSLHHIPLGIEASHALRSMQPQCPAT